MPMVAINLLLARQHSLERRQAIHWTMYYYQLQTGYGYGLL